MSEKQVKQIIGTLLKGNDQYHEHLGSTTGKALAATHKELIAQVKEVGKSGDIDLMMATEKAIITNELDNIANDKAAKNTWTNGLAETNEITNGLSLVRNEKQYRDMATNHYNLPKNQSSGLPNDPVRKCFRSHRARLNNQITARLSPTEKDLVTARMNNLSKVSKAYITMQEKALGMGTDKGKASKLAR